MNRLELIQTEECPKIILDKAKSEFLFLGRSIPNDSEKIFRPVLDWFKEYLKNTNPQTTIVFNLDYFNTSTQKYLIEFLKLISSNQNHNSKFLIEWHYSKDDEDMKMIGEQFENLTKLKFEYKVIL
jgi:hypothetical protein